MVLLLLLLWRDASRASVPLLRLLLLVMLRCRRGRTSIPLRTRRRRTSVLPRTGRRRPSPKLLPPLPSPSSCTIRARRRTQARLILMPPSTSTAAVPSP